MEESDTDLCLVIASPDLQAGQRMVSEMEKIRNRLSSRISPRTCWVVDAQVPILKFRDHQSGMKCELHLNNVVGIRNTHLLAMYARVDHRLPTLGVFVKHWAQKMGIHGDSLGKPNSYALLLMVIQYLQCGCSPPVLPNLQARFPEIFDCKRPVEELDMNSQLPWDQLRSANRSNVGELFAGFVKYYANFDFAHQAISVRNGCPMDVDLAIHIRPFIKPVNRLITFKIFVEDPCDQNNVAQTVCDCKALEEIRQAFTRTDEALRTRKSLQSLWEEELSLCST